MVDENLRLLRIIGRWKIAAAEEVDDIGEWRNNPSELDFRGWDNPPEHFWGQTTQISAALLSRNLSPEPIHQVYGAVNSWHADHSASRLPPQSQLFGYLEQAMSLVVGIEMELLERIKEPAPTDWLPVAAPSTWAKRFAMSLTTLKRRVDDESIRVDVITSKSWRVHRADAAEFGYSPTN